MAILIAYWTTCRHYYAFWEIQNRCSGSVDGVACTVCTGRLEYRKVRTVRNRCVHSLYVLRFVSCTTSQHRNTMMSLRHRSRYFQDDKARAKVALKAAVKLQKSFQQVAKVVPTRWKEVSKSSPESCSFDCEGRTKKQLWPCRKRFHEIAGRHLSR